MNLFTFLPKTAKITILAIYTFFAGSLDAGGVASGVVSYVGVFDPKIIYNQDEVLNEYASDFAEGRVNNEKINQELLELLHAKKKVCIYQTLLLATQRKLEALDQQQKESLARAKKCKVSDISTAISGLLKTIGAAIGGFATGGIIGSTLAGAATLGDTVNTLICRKEQTLNEALKFLQSTELQKIDLKVQKELLEKGLEKEPCSEFEREYVQLKRFMRSNPELCQSIEDKLIGYRSSPHDLYLGSHIKDFLGNALSLSTRNKPLLGTYPQYNEEKIWLEKFDVDPFFKVLDEELKTTVKEIIFTKFAELRSEEPLQKSTYYFYSEPGAGKSALACRIPIFLELPYHKVILDDPAECSKSNLSGTVIWHQGSHMGWIVEALTKKVIDRKLPLSTRIAIRAENEKLSSDQSNESKKKIVENLLKLGDHSYAHCQYHLESLRKEKDKQKQNQQLNEIQKNEDYQTCQKYYKQALEDAQCLNCASLIAKSLLKIGDLTIGDESKKYYQNVLNGAEVPAKFKDQANNRMKGKYTDGGEGTSYSNGFLIIDEFDKVINNPKTLSFALDFFDPDKTTLKSPYFNCLLNISNLTVICVGNKILPTDNTFESLKRRIKQIHCPDLLAEQKQKIFSNTLNNNLMHNYNMTNLPATIKAYIIQQAIDAGTLGDGNQKLNDIIVGIKSKRIDVEKICKNFETKKMIFSEYIDRLLQDYGQRNTLTKEEKSQFVEEAAIQDKLIVGRKRIKELITERLDPLEEL